MSLDTVVEDIREEARARADELLDEANAEAEEIVSEAEADAERLRQEREAEVERTIAQERDRSLSSAKLEAKQERLEARRDLLDEVREETESALTELEGDRREELTGALLEAALAEFDEESVVVRGREEDAELLERLLSDVEDAHVGDAYDCLGGVVVEGDGSRVKVNNTFDSLLEEVWDRNLKELSDTLFEQ
ncbi:A-type ATP synthase subunit E [Halalkaliarchaeum desulfuricum]|uniref:A-type ATP synthase subunit E n=1 Tax=Halalkaliarchaeum desulfuricum TaxID=2055893 RepID=A0A343TF17_9EURY|nr:V-type ATP synthase subunit E [Halalkaliarchaeum desulfuricum]AUX07689.1 A-type ATP synthase subunit E [Halalkaliarchaeum desulfuricum]